MPGDAFRIRKGDIYVTDMAATLTERRITVTVTYALEKLIYPGTWWGAEHQPPVDIVKFKQMVRRAKVIGAKINPFQR